MDARRAGQALSGHAAVVREAITGAGQQPMLNAAKKVAQQVRLAASHAGDPVAIRVVQKGTGVRFTVTGPRASKYRALVKDALDREMPTVEAEIRAMITRKAR